MPGYSYSKRKKFELNSILEHGDTTIVRLILVDLICLLISLSAICHP